MADAQFAIDVAANMSGAEQTFAELDALTAKLSGSGKDASHFQQAIRQVSDELAAASQTSAAATAALAEGQAEYKLLERAALQASRAAEKAGARNKGVVPPELAQKAAEAASAVDAYAVKLSSLEKEAAAASGKQKELGNTLGNLGKLQKHTADRLGDTTTKLSTFRGALGDVGGPVGELGERLLYPVQAFVDLNEQFGMAAAASTVAVVGITAVVAVLAVLAAAAAAAVGAVAVLAVKLADTRRSAALASEALAQVHPELNAVSGQMSALERTTGQTRAQLEQLAIKLKAAGVSAADLPTALKAAAQAEAALGQGGADQFIEDLKKGKSTVDEFASNMQTKFGGIVERKMLGIEAQTERLRSNLGALFGSLNIEPVLKGLRTLVSMFDEGTVVARAIKAVFEGIFQPLIDQAQNAAYVVEAFVLGVAIALTKVYIAIKPAIQYITDLFGIDTSGWELEDVLANVTKAAEYLTYGILAVVAVFAVVGAAIGAVVVVVAAVGLAFTAFQVAVVAAVLAVVAGVVWLAVQIGQAFATALQAVTDGVVWIVSSLAGLVTGAADAANGMIEYLTGIDLMQIGSDMIAGLANGISAGAGRVIAAITGVAQGAINTAKSILGIASPSKVFAAEVGEQIPAGQAEGIEAGAPEVQKAVDGLAEVPALDIPAPEVATAAGLDAPPSNDSPGQALDRATAADGYQARPPEAGASPSPTASGGASLTIQGNTFVFNGVANAEEAEARIEDVFTRLLEGDASSLGGGEEAA